MDDMAAHVHNILLDWLDGTDSARTSFPFVRRELRIRLPEVDADSKTKVILNFPSGASQRRKRQGP